MQCGLSLSLRGSKPKQPETMLLLLLPAILKRTLPRKSLIRRARVLEVRQYIYNDQGPILKYEET